MFPHLGGSCLTSIGTGRRFFMGDAMLKGIRRWLGTGLACLGAMLIVLGVVVHG